MFRPRNDDADQPRGERPHEVRARLAANERRLAGQYRSFDLVRGLVGLVVLGPALLIGCNYLYDDWRRRRGPSYPASLPPAVVLEAGVPDPLSLRFGSPRPTRANDEPLDAIDFGPEGPLPCPAGATSSSSGCIELVDGRPRAVGPQRTKHGDRTEGYVLGAARVREGPWRLWARQGHMLAAGYERGGVREGFFAGEFDGVAGWQQGRYIEGERQGVWVVPLTGAFRGEAQVNYVNGLPDGELRVGEDCAIPFVAGVPDGPARCRAWSGVFERGVPVPAKELGARTEAGHWLHVPGVERLPPPP